MKKGTLKPETLKRIQAEQIIHAQQARIDLYKRLINSAYKNRHNPTGRDYLDSAKRMRQQYTFLQ